MTMKSAATVRTSRKPPAGKTDPHRKIGSDLAKIDASEPSPAEMEEIPELTDALMAGADLYHGPKLVRRGRPPQAGAPKRQVTLRLATDLIDGYRRGAQDGRSEWRMRSGRPSIRAREAQAPKLLRHAPNQPRTG